MTSEQVVQAEAKIATKIVEDAIALGYLVTVNNGGDEDEIEKCGDVDKLIKAMFASDEDRLTFHRPNEKASYGWVLLIYGNDGHDVICDYVATDAIKKILKGAEALADEIEKAST